ncbi:MAG: DUF3047 domain-containing protein [Gemmatimonas sp.]
MNEQLRRLALVGSGIALACAVFVTSLAAANWADVRLDRIGQATVGDALPPGWQVRPVRGQKAPTTRVVQDDTYGQALRFEARGQAAFFGNELKVPIDVSNGRLRWSWRVDKPLANAVLQDAARDDSPARLMVIFGRQGLLARPRIIFYTWGHVEPRGTSFASRASDRLHVIVLRNREDPIGTWMTEERDLNADYRAAFGATSQNMGGIGFMSDTENVPSHGVALLGPVHWMPGVR